MEIKLNDALNTFSVIKDIIDSSQICFIKYDPYDDSFVISTDDRYSWRFRVVNMD